MRGEGRPVRREWGQREGGRRDPQGVSDAAGPATPPPLLGPAGSPASLPRPPTACLPVPSPPSSRSRATHCPALSCSSLPDLAAPASLLSTRAHSLLLRCSAPSPATSLSQSSHSMASQYPAQQYPNGQYPTQQQPQYTMQQQQQPQYAQPQYAQQPAMYGQPQYAQPQYGQPQYGQPGMQYMQQSQSTGMVVISSPVAAGMQPPQALMAMGQMGQGTMAMAAPPAPAGTPPGLEYFSVLDHIWVKEMPQMLEEVTNVELNQMYQCLNNQVTPTLHCPSPPSGELLSAAHLLSALCGGTCAGPAGVLGSGEHGVLLASVLRCPPPLHHPHPRPYWQERYAPQPSGAHEQRLVLLSAAHQLLLPAGHGRDGHQQPTAGPRGAALHALQPLVRPHGRRGGGARLHTRAVLHVGLLR